MVSISVLIIALEIFVLLIISHKCILYSTNILNLTVNLNFINSG